MVAQTTSQRGRNNIASSLTFVLVRNEIISFGSGHFNIVNLASCFYSILANECPPLDFAPTSTHPAPTQPPQYGGWTFQMTSGLCKSAQAETALAHVVGDRTEQAYRRSDALGAILFSAARRDRSASLSEGARGG